MRRIRLFTTGVAALATMGAFGVAAAPADASHTPFLDSATTVSTLASTVPANGDVNPYGVAVVRRSTGDLNRGSVLISNFNASSNLQGTGTTIVQVSPAGAVSTFATIDPAHLPGPCPGGVGLTTALAVFSDGWVVVGTLPTADGTAATAQAGCLLVLDSHGTVRETISGPLINGPWDMTATQHGRTADLYVTNVLNGTVAGGGAVVNQGTVVRIRLRLPEGGAGLPSASTPVVIASGFAERTDPAALVVGPTGLALRHETLYVADTASNRIDAVSDATDRRTSDGTGSVVTSDGMLNSPLGLAITREGDLLSVNGGDGLIVETTRGGNQVASEMLDSSGSPQGAGALFGLAVTPDGRGLYFVDDATNTLNLLS